LRNLLIILILLTCYFSSYSQKKKKRVIPLPPYKEQDAPFQDTLSLQDYSSPILFQWEMNADTTLKPGTVFKELIKLTYGRTEVNGYYSEQALTIKKVKGIKNPQEIEIPKMITRVTYYDALISNGIVILKGSKVMSLKIVYDKNKQVKHLKDLDNGNIYLHIPSDEHPISALSSQ